MILFHGTLEENLKSIRKNGLMAVTQDPWLMEVCGEKVACTGNCPTSGEGGNPTYFAYGSIKSRNQDGYLVVFDVPRAILAEKKIAIFSNKALDDYVRYHFFIRAEFRAMGRELFRRMTEYSRQDHRFQRLADGVRKRKGEEKDALLFAPTEPRQYYKKLRDEDERCMFLVLGMEITDELHDFISFLGSWPVFYEFLKLHFGEWQSEKERFWEENAHKTPAQYWKSFYERFPMRLTEAKHKHWDAWFAPSWLATRALPEIEENCQILSRSLEPQYLVGFIKTTTPSGFAAPFRSCRAKSTFAKEIWRAVHRLLAEQKR